MDKALSAKTTDMSDILCDDIASIIRSLRTNCQFTDLSFAMKTGGKKFEVHKLVLAMRSPVFKDIIYKQGHVDSITVDSDDENAIKNMIRYFYDDQVLLENIHDIENTKALADKYEIFQLSKLCEEKLSDIKISSMNVFNMLEMAKEFGNKEKEKECLNFMNENLETECIFQQFMGMPFEIFLSNLEQLKIINMLSESKLLYIAVKWLVKNDPKNEDFQTLIMDKIDLTNISVIDYFDIVPLFTDSSLEKSLVLNLIKKIYHEVALEKEKMKKREEKMQCKLHKQENRIEEIQHQLDQQLKHDKEMQCKFSQQEQQFENMQIRIKEYEHMINSQRELLKRNEEHTQKLQVAFDRNAKQFQKDIQLFSEKLVVIESRHENLLKQTSASLLQLQIELNSQRQAQMQTVQQHPLPQYLGAAQSQTQQSMQTGNLYSTLPMQQVAYQNMMPQQGNNYTNNLYPQ